MNLSIFCDPHIQKEDSKNCKTCELLYVLWHRDDDQKTKEWMERRGERAEDFSSYRKRVGDTALVDALEGAQIGWSGTI